MGPVDMITLFVAFAFFLYKDDNRRLNLSQMMKNISFEVLCPAIFLTYGIYSLPRGSSKDFFLNFTCFSCCCNVTKVDLGSNFPCKLVGKINIFLQDL